MEVFPDLISSISDPDPIKQHYGMIGVRKILSIAEAPPIQAVIDAGLVPKMIEYVKQQEFPQLQLEATWALTNVASGTTIQCQSIIDKGGIPLFVELLRSQNAGIVEQAIWAIGNISSDCIFYRDNIIRAGGLENLVHVVTTTHEETLIKHGCWALSNLCRGSPLPRYDFVKSSIPVLCKAIASKRLVDKEIIADCCWAISYHSDANKNKIQTVIDSGVVPNIIKNLEEPSMAILVPSIRILGNISTGSSDHTNELLNFDILSPLERVLEHHKKVVRREACWVISNIAAGTRAQVEAILSRESLIKKVL
jgi:importin subunit alpha-6/7